MSVSGFESHLMVGADVYFKRRPINGIHQPFVCLGTIQDAVSPKFDRERKQVYHGGGGRARLRAERTRNKSEMWEMTTQNLSRRNLALAWGGALAGYTRSADPILQSAHRLVGEGELIELRNNGANYDAGGARQWNLSSVDFVCSERGTITAADVGDKTFTLNLTTLSGYNLDETRQIRVWNNGSIEAQTFTIADSAVVSGHVVITTVEAITGANEAGGGTLALVLRRGQDWEVASLLHGTIRVLDTPGPGEFSEDNPCQIFVDMTPVAVEGLRTISPDYLADTILGDIEIFLGDEDNETVWVRRGQVSLTCTDVKLGTEDFNSISLNVTFLEDPTDQSYPMGAMDLIKGELEAAS